MLTSIEVESATNIFPLAPDINSAELMGKFFRGLGDPGRVRIMQVLLEGDKNVSELVAALGLGQSRVSNHLSCLRWCGFVTSYRQGKYVYYRIADPSVRQLIALAQSLINRNGMQLASCTIIGELEKRKTYVETLLARPGRGHAGDPLLHRPSAPADRSVGSPGGQRR